MRTRSRRSVALTSLTLAALAGCAHAPRTSTSHSAREPMRYTIRVPIPATRTFDVDVVVPTDGRDSVVLAMPVWSPGMYTRQSYGSRVKAFVARAADGSTLDVSHPDEGHWVVRTGKRSTITATYTVDAPRGNNLGNGATDTSLVVIGPATYVMLAGETARPADVRLVLPPSWKPAITSLAAAADGAPNHFVAPDYDILADAPILAGTRMSSAEVTVGGTRHRWAYLGDAEWSAPQAVAWVTPLLEAHRRFWGDAFPIRDYVFLNMVGASPGSGIEHLNSVAINTNGRAPQNRAANFRQASFISHEYFHAMNVKRLRPVELGPFDYEHTPVTTGLWVAEGLTSYFGDLLAARGGLGDAGDYLALMSQHIKNVQTSPGRLVQSLEQASAQMFERIPADKRIDYYEKGPVVGLVLDAHIRKQTNGRKSMDDVIRLEFARWSGARGYSADDFAKTATDAVGFDLEPLLRRLVGSTEEIDYTEMLDWFGLQFKAGEDPATKWTLDVRPDATDAQKGHLAALLTPSGPGGKD